MQLKVTLALQLISLRTPSHSIMGGKFGESKAVSLSSKSRKAKQKK
jgi:hypothetical protein